MQGCTRNTIVITTALFITVFTSLPSFAQQKTTDITRMKNASAGCMGCHQGGSMMMNTAPATKAKAHQKAKHAPSKKSLSTLNAG